MSIYLTWPHKGIDALKLLKYLQTIRNLSERGDDWRSYDESLWSLRMANSWEWDFVHWDMWMNAAQPQIQPTPRFVAGRGGEGASFLNKERAGPLPTNIGKPCFAFNTGEMCSTKTCRFKHICKQCAGNHPLVRCANRTPSNQKQSTSFAGRPK